MMQTAYLSKTMVLMGVDGGVPAKAAEVPAATAAVVVLVLTVAAARATKSGTLCDVC